MTSGAPIRDGEHGATKQCGWQNVCKRSSKISPNPLLYSRGLRPCPSSPRMETGSLLSTEDETRSSGNDQHQAQLKAENHKEKGLNRRLYIECCDPQNANNQTYSLQEGNRKTCCIDNLMSSRGKIQRCYIRSSSIKGPTTLP